MKFEFCRRRPIGAAAGPNDNMHLFFSNDDGLLCAYDDTNKLVFKWTYSVFEEHAHQAIAPSMYIWMTDYIVSHLCGRPTDRMNKEAVDAYFRLPLAERVAGHNQLMMMLEYRQKMSYAPKLDHQMYKEERSLFAS